MIELTKTMRTGIKIAISILICMVGLAHTSLFNHFMQKKEQAAWQFFMGCFKQSVLSRPNRLAVFMGVNIPAINEMLQAMVDMCQARGMKLELKKFYFNNDLSLLKGQIEEGIAWEARALITVGSVTAQAAHTTLTKRNSQIPHIFACVTDPVQLGISKEKYVTGTTSTGIAEDDTGILNGFEQSFQHVRPDAQKVLIFYSGTSQKAQSNVTNLIRAFAEKKIQAGSVHTATLEEVSRCAQTFITRDIDAVIVLRDFVVVSALESILKVCRIHGTTVFASDSGSVRNGAVAGCCVDEAELGLLLAEIILKVVHQGLPCNKVPITYFTTSRLYRTHVNQYEMHTQGLHNRSIYTLMSGEAKLEFLRNQ